MIGTGCASKAEIDSAREERLERPELFGDDERRVVGKHDAAGTDADRLRATGDVRDHHGGRGARNARHVVMFGEPEADVAEPLGMTREIEGVLERRRRVAPLRDRREIEHRKRDHRIRR